MAEQVDLINRIELGLDVEAFMASRVGRYVQKRANDEIEAARDELENLPPSAIEAIQTAQNKAKVARAVLDWMGEAVTDGENAAEVAQAINADLSPPV